MSSRPSSPEPTDRLAPFRRTVALLLLVGLALGGLPPLLEELRRAPTPVTPEATIDRWLALLRLPDPAADVTRVVGDFPGRERVLFVTPEDHPGGALTFYLISILAWPRPVRWLACPPPGRPIDWVVPGDHPASPWLVYLDQPVPSRFRRQGAIGPRLDVARNPVELDWNSYCRP